MKGKPTAGSDIDLGLALLGVLNQPRVPLSQVEIAAYCGCTRQAVEQIEKKALRKLRNKLRFGLNNGQLWTELMSEMFNRREVANAKTFE